MQALETILNTNLIRSEECKIYTPQQLLDGNLQANQAPSIRCAVCRCFSTPQGLGMGASAPCFLLLGDELRLISSLPSRMGEPHATRLTMKDRIMMIAMAASRIWLNRTLRFSCFERVCFFLAIRFSSETDLTTPAPRLPARSFA